MNRKKSGQQQPGQQNPKSGERVSLVTESRGGGQPKPRTPSGEVKQWEPPKKGTTPSNRKK